MNPTRAARQADATCAELDQIITLVFGPAGLKQPAYVAYRRRVHSVIVRDNEPARIDGYKSRHGDTSGTGGNSELTAVEQAAARLVEHGQPADIVHAKVTLIVANVRQARDRLVGIDNALRLIPTSPGTPAPEAAVCSNCRIEPGDRETDVNGALPGARFLGLWCIDFVERQGGKVVGRHKPRLPSDVEIKAWQQGRKPRAHIDPKAKPFGFNNADGSRSYTGLAVTDLPPSAA